MSLKKYTAKRNLSRSNEPPAKKHTRKKKDLLFVVQKHAARHLHYDFRLEVNGVLKSWAIPKGPSLNPKIKRLAIEVEDHPYDYKDFEGIIAEGYGAGTVLVWDQGTYHVDERSAKESEKSIEEGFQKGELHFTLEGHKLKGAFSLVRLHGGGKENEWLLIKKKDAFASTEEITKKERSVLSQATIEELDPSKRGAKNKKPHHVDPMLATLIEKPFNDEAWIFEIKWDGFRALAETKGNQVELYSRNFHSFNSRFPTIVEHLKQLNVDAIFDGEIVVLNKKGKPDFQRLQNIQQSLSNEENLYYYVFDLLYLKGRDLRSLPLIERKKNLAGLLTPHSSSIRYLDHIETKGIPFFQACLKNDLEGIIGKRKKSAYLSGQRTKEWVKIKTHLRQEVVICGFTEPKGSRKTIGALIVGVYKKNVLHFVGHVGGGFTVKTLDEIKKRLLPLIQTQSPFKQPPKTNTPVTWVKPHYLCEVTFSEWTSEGLMRQPIFIGLREDKSPREVIKEVSSRRKRSTHDEKKPFLTHLDKVFWPDEKITKGDLIEYYESVAPLLLPYLKDRPESLKRFPNGIQGTCFFQKNIKTTPDWIHTVKIQQKEKLVNYLLIQDLDSLLYAINLGCIELHPFFSRADSLNKPDFLVFDLDPVEIDFVKVVETAQAIHTILEELHIPSYCKTSGARGLHICVPLKAKYTYEQAKQFAQLIALIVHHHHPDFTSLERIPKNRRKKVYIDCLQNNPGQTIVSPYSVRAKPQAPVSTPLKWSEVNGHLNPLAFTIHSLPKRLKKVGDLFTPLLEQEISFEKILPKVAQWVSELRRSHK